MDVSDEILAAVGRTADASWRKQVDLEALEYERGKLAELGVIVPPHTLHDYGEQATRVIVEAIKLRAQCMTRMQKRHGAWPVTAMYHLSPIFAALQVERGRLERMERRAA
jgi:hypothetical protein